MSREREARLCSPGEWGTYGNHHEHMRYVVGSKNRRKCHCGCGGRVTHSGMANGVCLISGCELYVRRWVRDGRWPVAIRSAIAAS